MTITYSPLTDHNIMELWLFETCNFRCGYCGLVTSGAVANTEQLEPYRDVKYIDCLSDFFRTHRPGGRPWVVMLTGGEPTMMPNLDRFVEQLGRLGDKVAIYTNMSIPLTKVLDRAALRHLAYLEASFHPDWHMGKFKEDEFFKNVAIAKSCDVPVLVRFVGAPQVLELLEHLEARCREAGVTFMPTTLFNPDYPQGYTTAERVTLASYMRGYSSLIQLDGGVLMEGRRCAAGDRLFAARIHQGGDITPCISTDRPIIGNVLENRLAPIPGLKGCFRGDQVCTCDVHFQQGIVEGVDDTVDFAAILNGGAPNRADSYHQWKMSQGIETSGGVWVGQGVTVSSKSNLLRKVVRISPSGSASSQRKL